MHFKMHCTEFALFVIASSIGYCTSDSSFLWGSATASYQVEGAFDEDGRGMTVWDAFSHTPGKVSNGDNGDIADDDYHRFSEDIDLMSTMGLKAYRFSIAWSRIFPDGETDINQAGIDHYNAVLNKLVKANIVPLVTLFHWDTPLALESKYGGWLNDTMETRKISCALSTCMCLTLRITSQISQSMRMYAFNSLGTGSSIGLHSMSQCRFL
jgi:hypothetical protein